MRIFIVVLSFFAVIVLILSGCSTRYAKMYAGPDLDKSQISIIKGCCDRLYLQAIDEKKLCGFWSGCPREVHVLPGYHYIKPVYYIGGDKKIRKNSIEFVAEPGKTYYIWYGLCMPSICSPYSFCSIATAKNINIIPKQPNIYTDPFYKKTPNEQMDFLISIVKQGAFDFSKLENKRIDKVKISLFMSFALLNNKDFQCGKFFSKLTSEEKNALNKAMKYYPFVCNDKNYSVEDVVSTYDFLFNYNALRWDEIDAYWIWFMATGNAEPLMHILNYYSSEAYSEEGLQAFLKIAVSTNDDIKQFVTTYMQGKSPYVKKRLHAILPANN